jgi:hypothetical protein
MVAEGELKYILWSGNGGPSGGQSDISAWVAAHGTPVQYSGSQMGSSAATDDRSAGARSDGAAFGGSGGMGGTLYELSADVHS